MAKQSKQAPQVQVRKGYPIFEVQKFGTTLEFDQNFARAEGAFNSASPGGVVMYRLDLGTARKVVIRKR